MNAVDERYAHVCCLCHLICFVSATVGSSGLSLTEVAAETWHKLNECLPGEPGNPKQTSDCQNHDFL